MLKKKYRSESPTEIMGGPQHHNSAVPPPKITPGAKSVWNNAVMCTGCHYFGAPTSAFPPERDRRMAATLLWVSPSPLDTKLPSGLCHQRSVGRKEAFLQSKLRTETISELSVACQKHTRFIQSPLKTFLCHIDRLNCTKILLSSEMRLLFQSLCLERKKK